MNTPEPCCRCSNLYYDAMGKNDPDCYRDCTKGIPLYPKGDCPEFDRDPADLNISEYRLTQALEAAHKLEGTLCRIHDSDLDFPDDLYDEMVKKANFAREKLEKEWKRVLGKHYVEVDP